MATQRKRRSNQARRAAKRRRISRLIRRQIVQASQIDRLALQRAVARPEVASPADVLALQRAYGNRAVVPLFAQASPLQIQAKLAVNTVGDRYEQEADRVADQVMRQMSAHPIQAESGEEAQPVVQRRSGEGGIAVASKLESAVQQARSGGQPLSIDVRAAMEQALGTDLGGVRVHTDEGADALSQSLQARAFTTGQDVFFRSGEYDPGSSAGQQLIAHELTHTQQQGASNRVARWAAKGHRLVTKLALEKGKFEQFYSSGARNYLVDRSPDMDFKHSGFTTMQKGRKQSKKKLKEYQKLIAEGKTKEDQTKIDKAKGMYERNDLHIREEPYMDNHGESGYYKNTDPSKNEGVTDTLISQAVKLWETKNPLQSLAILADALHQAEDRGAHEEGSPLHGHDTRLNLNTEEWEKEGKARYGREEWDPGSDPDNVSVNSKGAALAVGHAERGLTKFKDDIKLPKKKKISTPAIKKSFKPKRRVRILGFIPMKSSGKSLLGLGGKVGDTGLGKTGGYKKLKKVFDEQMKKPEIKEAYETARVGSQETKMAFVREIGNIIGGSDLMKELDQVFKKKK